MNIFDILKKIIGAPVGGKVQTQKTVNPLPHSEDNSVLLRSVLILFGFNCFTRIMRILTRYPPFSFFWLDRFFHYENTDIYEAMNKIVELIMDTGYLFYVYEVDRDQYFLTLGGKFKKWKRKSNIEEKYEQIALRLEKENMLLRLDENGRARILVKRTN